MKKQKTGLISHNYRVNIKDRSNNVIALKVIDEGAGNYIEIYTENIESSFSIETNEDIDFICKTLKELLKSKCYQPLNVTKV